MAKLSIPLIFNRMDEAIEAAVDAKVGQAVSVNNRLYRVVEGFDSNVLRATTCNDTTIQRPDDGRFFKAAANGGKAVYTL